MVNVIPVEDEKEHVTSCDCWCDPTVSWINPDTEMPWGNGPLIVHNAFDCREIVEEVTGEKYIHGWMYVVD